MVYERVIQAIRYNHKEIALIIEVSAIVADYVGAEKTNFLIGKERVP